MKIRQLSKTYTLKSGIVKALDGVNIDLPEKGLIIILGKSGSGKSTLLNLLSGLDCADKGSVIEIGGKDIVECSEKERAGYRNSCCGFVFQEYNLIPELKVKENVKLSCELQGEKNGDKAADDALDKVGLSGYGERKITELSGGQKQRVAIARAIVKNPQIIFADEPTGALDEATGESIFELLKSISESKLVVTVTHDREYAEKYGDRIIELSDGKIISDSDAGFAEQEQTSKEYKKPKLPIKAAAKIGCANFKFHPIRLAATILLSVIAFTFLGIAFSSAFNSYVNIVYDAMVSDGVIYSAVYKYYDGMELSEKILQKELVSIFGTQTSFGVIYSSEPEASYDSDNLYEDILPSGFSEITHAQADKCGFSIVGRLAQNDGELCLTAFSADKLNMREYRKHNFEDIIGESIKVGERDYTIVGIVDTRFDGEKYSALKNTAKHGPLSEMYALEISCSPHNIMFIDDIEKYANDGFDIAIVKNSRSVIRYITGDGEFKLNNGVVSNAEKYIVTIDRIKNIAGIISVVFAVFAVILLFNFLLQSFTDKFYTLGILKANGCGVGGMFKVFLCEAFVISVVTFIASCAFTIIFDIVLNARFGLAFFGALYAALPMLFVVVATVAFSSCAIPLVKIKRMTAVGIINVNR